MSDKDNILKIIDRSINVCIAIALTIDIFFIPFGIFIAGSTFAIAALFAYKFNKVRIPPNYFPIISEDWVLWEYTVCIDTKGLKLRVEDLHNALVEVVRHQDMPLNVVKVNSIAIRAASIGIVIIVNLFQVSNPILGSIFAILLFISIWIIIKINYEFNVLPARRMYSRAEIIKYERELERVNEITSIRSEELPRHFKWDDLRIFHEVTRKLVVDIIIDRLEQHESIFTEAKEFNLFKNIIPPTKKDLFDRIR